MRGFFPVLAGSVLFLGLLGCGPSADKSTLEFRVPVMVDVVRPGSVEDTLKLTGSLRASRTVELNAETKGVLRIGVDARGRRLAEGDRVKKGQVIVELTGEDVRVAARTEATRHRFLSARSDLEARKKLFEDGLITESDLRLAETTLEEARLEYDRSRLSERRSVLVTPIDGVILQLARDQKGRPIAEGQLLTPGQLVAQIAADGQLIADVNVFGPDIGRIRVGQEARLTTIAFPGEEFKGRVLRLAPSVDTLSRTLAVEVRVENPGGVLKPGLFVQVSVLVSRRENVPVVPRSALVRRAGKLVVFVAKGQRVEQREVEPGLGDDSVVEVLSGVMEGESIVIRGMETLSDASKIRISN